MPSPAPPSRQAPPALVIFDCDGVLVDSEPLAAQVLTDALAALGLKQSVADVDAQFRGRSLKDCLVLIETELGRPLPLTFLDELDRNTRAAFDEGLKAIPHIHEAISAILAAEIPVCVASSGSHQKIEHSLKLVGLWDVLQGAIFSASDVSRGKPFPDLFLHAAAQMRVPIQDCVVIEDSLFGTQAGLSAGAQVLVYGPGPLAVELTDTGAIALHSMLDLPAALGLGAMLAPAPKP